MSRVRRLHLATELRHGGEVTLDEAATHRLRDVLRLRAGDALRLFDGAGTECEAQVVEVERRSVRLAIGAVVPSLAEPAAPVWLACAFPRGQRGDWLVEKATECGAAAFVATAAERSVMHAGTGRLDRWQRIAIEAAEQCGRAVVPTFEPEPPAGARHLLADPEATRTPEEALVAPAADAAAAVVLHIGPEGGWTAAEREQLVAAGALAVTLGPRVLRVETAAVLAVARVVQALEAR